MYSVQNYLHDSVIIDMLVLICPNLRNVNHQGNLNMSCGPWMTLRCSCSLIYYLTRKGVVGEEQNKQMFVFCSLLNVTGTSITSRNSFGQEVRQQVDRQIPNGRAKQQLHGQILDYLKSCLHIFHQEPQIIWHHSTSVQSQKNLWLSSHLI